MCGPRVFYQYNDHGSHYVTYFQSKLEEEVINLEDMLREKEKLEAYLQSQVKAKDMPKLSRRSTLLRTPSETSLVSFKFP